MTEVLQAAPLAVSVTSPPGTPAVQYGIALGMFETSITDDLPTWVEVAATGAGSLEVVTFDIDGTDVWYTNADVYGEVGPLDLPLSGGLTAGVHTLTVTSPLNGTDSEDFTIVNAAVTGADPGIDDAPELIGGSTGRWVFQDLMPGGIGSWVMEINPTAMSNPHVSKVVQTRHSTSPPGGQYHVGESNLGVAAWTISGYCPNEAFHNNLTAYAELNRRIYVIDHRARAWKCAVVSLEITPRKRQTEEDGTSQDWAGDWRMVLSILDQVFLTPA